MCAIVDTNVAHQVFRHDRRTQSGEIFFEWINRGRGRLVVGGRLRRELAQSGPATRDWMLEAQLSGKMTELNDEEVDARAAELERQGRYTSDDPHILALAQLGGARLLFSHDRRLQDDFKNGHLINNPLGDVYPTPETASSPDERDLPRHQQSSLRRANICRAGS